MTRMSGLKIHSVIKISCMAGVSSEVGPLLHPSAGVSSEVGPLLHSIRLSCQDLDKTTYVPGDEQTNRRNLQAMTKFEALERGGKHMAVFVTGNNVAMAQEKATIMMAGDESLTARFSDLTKQPGIYSNGALVKGLAGVTLEEFCKPLPSPFVTALVDAIATCPQRPCASLPDDCGFIFYSMTQMIMLDDAAVHARLRASDASMRRAKGFCEDMMHMPVAFLPAEAIKGLASRREIYQVTVLYEWIELAGTELKNEYTAQHGAATEGRQQELAKLIEDGERQLAFKALSAPWPSLDINAHGVNKRNAIVALCTHLSTAIAQAPITMEHVAVFGDAANDLPMFEPVDESAPVAGFAGQRAAVRVGMPGARCTEPLLAKASNVRADVYTVLEHAVELQSQRGGSVG